MQDRFLYKRPLSVHLCCVVDRLTRDVDDPRQEVSDYRVLLRTHPSYEVSQLDPFRFFSGLSQAGVRYASRLQRFLFI